MMRASRISVFVALLFVVTAMPAWAAKPQVFPPESVDSTGVLADFCSFDVGFHIEGKTGAILFENRAIITAPGMEIHLTNLTTGKAVSLKIPGTFHDTLLDDAGNVRTHNVGRNLLFGHFDGVPGIFLTIGKIVTDWNVNDDPADFHVIESESAGQMIDVCDMLS